MEHNWEYFVCSNTINTQNWEQSSFENWHSNNRKNSIKSMGKVVLPLVYLGCCCIKFQLWLVKKKLAHKIQVDMSNNVYYCGRLTLSLPRSSSSIRHLKICLPIKKLENLPRQTHVCFLNQKFKNWHVHTANHSAQKRNKNWPQFSKKTIALKQNTNQIFNVS